MSVVGLGVVLIGRLMFGVFVAHCISEVSEYLCN